MATLAADHTGARKSAEPPISAHPAFPAIVALWFAALLGLGSLILPTLLLERLTTVTGIAALFPSAAPPLGFTARSAIAIGGSLVGAVLGLVLARQVASGQVPRPRYAEETRHCRPISAHDELGEEGLDAPAARGTGTRRRSLAIAEDDAPSRFLGAAPLPGQGEMVGDDAAGDALDLGDFVAQDEPQAEQNDQDFSAADARGLDPHPEDAHTAEARQEFVPATGAGADSPHVFDPVPEPQSENDGEPATDEALPFSAPSLRRAPVQENTPPAVPQAYEPVAGQEDEEGDMPEESNITHGDRPLGELGLVQLATRLGTAIERRRSLRTAPPPPHPAAGAAFAAAEDLDAAEAEDAARARADYFGGRSESEPVKPVVPPSPVVAPHSPLAEFEFGEDDESGDDDLAASLSLPLRRRQSNMPAEQVADDTRDEDNEDPTAEHEYTSLLAMKNPFRKEAEEFVRVDEPETDEDEIEAGVIFPEHKSKPEAPQSAGIRPFDPPVETTSPRQASALRNQGDAERELRAALQTLQRMSGAA